VSVPFDDFGRNPEWVCSDGEIDHEAESQMDGPHMA
jgi:hypothetical protein